MAIGLDIVVPSATDPDSTLPYASSLDSRITPGSLVLLEPTHSQGAWPSGVATSYVPNVAYGLAAAVIGAGDATTLRGLLTTDTSDSTKLAFERTTKGALHTISSAGARGGKNGHLDIPSPLYTYWLTGTNKNRAMAAFIWMHVTRAASATANLNELGVFNLASGASNSLYRDVIDNTIGAKRTSLSMPTGWTGSPNANLALDGGGVWFGNSGPYNGTNGANGKSFVLYSYHLVDILASGRTYAELDAIDAAAYAEAFGVGGRFYGDSWTSPASVNT